MTYTPRADMDLPADKRRRFEYRAPSGVRAAEVHEAWEIARRTNPMPAYLGWLFRTLGEMLTGWTGVGVLVNDQPVPIPFAPGRVGEAMTAGDAEELLSVLLMGIGEADLPSSSSPATGGQAGSAAAADAAPSAIAAAVNGR